MRRLLAAIALALALTGCAPASAPDPTETAMSDATRDLLAAAASGDAAAVRAVLIEAGADVDAKDDIQDSAYLYAGARGHDEILRMTLEHGADLRSTNRYGGTALIPASERGLLSTVEILLEAGVDPNHVNNLGWTALHEAIVLGDGSEKYVRVVRALIDGGADVTIPDGDGVLPRDLAAQRSYDAIVAEIDR
ncbi:ankyrin repeat domain-containing protein [Microbacterium sp. EF45047]|uniref:ankyrin repeat domain-containing protein n=1 Tax=Microbacterium sp. EF45047 TaxID=2809708 RepID=UPI00234B84D3|nr:ankyrin repeat domain-containing protein [Microbacterium sp. EF45047]WCM55523.1 ankyrin repeat domain-containing protein [Microbacterium sp. EF45047]